MLSHLFRKLRPAKATETLETVRANGQVWHFRAGAAELLGGIPDIVDWERRGWASLVKKNLQRSIWRVALPGGAIYFKLCRTNTPRAWIRDILRPPKAQLEFENALALQSRGIGCTEPLAWGMSDGLWPGDSFIVTREQSNAEPLDLFLTRPLTSSRRRTMAVAFGHYLAKLRDAGVVHPDAHPGNFLLEWIDAPRFFLLDVHAVQTSPTAVDRNLVLLNRWFQMRSTRTDRLRFWRAYTSQNSKSLPKELETQTRESNLHFWQNRLSRYVGNNREYRKIRRPGVRGHAVKDLPDELLLKWIADPDAVFQVASILKDSRSSTVAIFEHGGKKYIAKRFRRSGLLTGIKNRLRCSPALRSWIFGQSLRDRGLPTARPLAVLQRYRRGLPREGYLLFEYIACAVELPDAVTQATGIERQRLAETLGRLLRDVHDRGVSHRDLKAPNILIADGEPVLVDLVGVRVGLKIADAERIRNLARLNASFVGSALVTRADRLRFLRSYSSWSMRPAGDWKTFWRAIAAETLAKIEKNRRSGRVLA